MEVFGHVFVGDEGARSSPPEYTNKHWYPDRTGFYGAVRHAHGNGEP